jgi:PhnB protein
MSASYKPEGYTSVAPYLIVDDAARTIDFVLRTFRATEIRRLHDKSGGIRHAEIRIDDSVVMLADKALGWPPIEAHVHVYVADVDATYRRAIEAGATPVQEPVKKDDADKRGGVKDAGGTIWWIATKVE